MIELKPIRISTEEYDAIEKKIKELFKKEIYIPLLKEFSESQKVLKNSKEDLLRALHAGRLTYYRGKFSGKLNATLSKELRSLGAKWNRIEKCYSIRQADLPQDVRSAISTSIARFEEKMQSVDRKLAAVVPEELAKKLKISDLFDKTIFKVEKEFQKSVKNLTVAPQLSDEARRRLADEWQNNMQLYIKDFTQEQIMKLRGDMQASVLAGNRYESAIGTIQKSYGVSANKAKFLARQETALMTGKLKEIRYQDAGINEYKWKSVVGTPLHPVRPRHKALNDASQIRGELFRFDDPPIVSEPGQAERRANAGMDFNCRCVSIAVIRKIPR